MGKDEGHTPSAKNPVQEKLTTEWKELCAADQFDAESATSLLKDLYGATAAATGISTVHRVAHQSIQSRQRGEIYARRLFTEYLDPDGIRDQVILSLMQRAASSDPFAMRKLAEVITDSAPASAAFEDFANPVNFKEELCLLTEVYAVIRKRHGAQADRDGCPGFFAPWRRITGNRPKDFENWLVTELAKCIPGHLRLLTNIYYYWLGTDRHSRAERLRAREVILSSVRKAWETASPQAVAAGFDATFPYVLFHLVFTSDYNQPDSVPLGGVDDWLWSGPILLKAASESPATMLPQILIALNADEHRGGPEIRFELNRERLHKWFGAGAGQLLALIAKDFEVDPEMTEATKYLIKLSIEKVRAELAKHEPPHSSPEEYE